MTPPCSFMHSILWKSKSQVDIRVSWPQILHKKPGSGQELTGLPSSSNTPSAKVADINLCHFFFCSSKHYQYYVHVIQTELQPANSDPRSVSHNKSFNFTNRVRWNRSVSSICWRHLAHILSPVLLMVSHPLRIVRGNRIQLCSREPLGKVHVTLVLFSGISKKERKKQSYSRTTSFTS